MGARNGLGKPTAGWAALAITVALALVAAFATAGHGQREPERERATTASDDGRFRLGPDQVRRGERLRRRQPDHPDGR